MKRCLLLLLMSCILASAGFAQPADQETVFSVNYGEVEEIRSFLEAMLPGVRIRADAEKRELRVQGDAAGVEQCLELLDQIDQPPDSVLLEVRLVTTTPEQDRSRGTEWADGQYFGGPAGRMKIGSESLREEFKPFGGPAVGGQQTRTFPVALTAGTPWWPESLLQTQAITQSGSPGEAAWGDLVAVPPQKLPKPSAPAFDFLGLHLKFRADVKQDGYIVVNVQSETQTLTQSGDRTNLRFRTYTTDCRMRPGETLAIKGLLASEDLNTMAAPALYPHMALLSAANREPGAQTAILIRATSLVPQGPPVKARRQLSRKTKSDLAR